MLFGILLMQSYFWLTCVVGLLLYYNYSRRKLYWLSWQLPGPVAFPLIGNCLEYVGVPVKDILGLVHKKIQLYEADLMRVWFCTSLWLGVMEPGLVYQINQRMLLKPKEYQYLMKGFSEKGNFNTNDMPYWKHCKTAYFSGLSSENLKSFIQVFHEEALGTKDLFQKYSDKDESVHTADAFSKFTLSCVAQCIFNFDIHTKSEKENTEFMRAIDECLEVMQKRTFIPVLRSDFFYKLVGLQAKETRNINTVKAYLQTIVDHHRKNKTHESLKNVKSTKNVEDTLFIHYMMGDKMNLSDEDILGQMFTMVLGATDTLITTYTALLILLGQHPQIQEKVYKEVVQNLGDDFNMCPSIPELNRLEYLERVLKECLRLFPPGPYLGRYVHEDFTVKDSSNREYVIPAGTTALLMVRSIMNSAKFFENPQVFDPDRWLPENVAKRHPYSFLAFSNGPRKCPGNRFAMLQMKTMVSTLVRAFEIQSTESCAKIEDIRYHMTMTIHIDSACKVLFRERYNRRKAHRNIVDFSSLIESSWCHQDESHRR